MKKRLALIITLFLCLNFCFGQKKTSDILIDDILILLKKHHHAILINKKASINDAFLLNYIDCQIEKNTLGRITENLYNKFSQTKPLSQYQKAIYNLNKGDYLYSINKFAVSQYLNEYEQALRIGKELKSKPIICEALKRICYHYLDTQKNISLLNESIIEYKEYAYDAFEHFYYNFFKTNNLMQNAFGTTKKIDISILNDLIIKSKKTNLHLLKGEAYQLKSVYYTMFENNLDSAIIYVNKSKKEYSKFNTPFIKNKKIGLEINKAIILQKKEKFKTSITLLDSLRSNQSKVTNPRYKLSINQFLKEGNHSLKKFESAYNYQQIESKIKDSLDLINQDLKLAEIKAKYDTSELEKLALIEQQKKNQNKNIAIGLGGSLFLGGIIAFLVFRNTKRKQKLAEQEQEIQKQKVTTLLKEQEINSINAMIDGQEKERQQIANDLHDDLGGLMATVKLHFNSLREKPTETLYEQTNNLINDAYKKIRSIAHAKNSGVIAKQGLLKAVQNIANKISRASNIEIEVSDFGLESRLENSLEITIFRIVQELTTNIIKHANATQAFISLTNHENSLNIMIEDNGKGFNTNKVIKNDGMGLHSIEKRIEYIEGEITIESQPNKGTTIIIDIPL